MLTTGHVDHFARDHLPRKELQPDFLFESVQLLAQFTPLGIGDVAHLAVGVREQRLDIFKFGGSGAVIADRLHDRRQVGEFARQLHEIVGADLGIQARLDFRMAYDQGFEFDLGKHGFA